MKHRSWIRRYWRYVLLFAGFALLFTGPIVLIAGMLVYGTDDVEPLKNCLLAAILLMCGGITMKASPARGVLVVWGVEG